MIQTIEWKAIPRTIGKKSEVKEFRKKGYLPTEVYGKGHENIHVYIPKKLLLSRPHGNFLINLVIEGEQEPKICVLKDIQYNYLGDEPIHVDLYEVSMGVELDVEVPIDLIGRPVGLEKGGLLEHHLHTIMVRTVPRNIPEKIEVDISNLDVGDVLHVRDIPVPEGVKILTPADEVVVVISEPEVEEVAEEETAA
ncbi:50S ribosomal protein L25/general stress protein Ctc [Venenivibrio stagnispumantis]|uniref:Large ribosomal subunit protein bL25 n=1 Tax=Venenivibrio stagnispumantis TaxID=407998 RepID=A0AA45WN87_9AQUI|nr:50S ribosomal protein L25/general stress protein Ctc [Venenivibrio stagnispumantis]MCW4573596.1 50S ribosomal protein L25/general stress protein Ctc [Venenivibrio stagnispumantis]SMP16883.1 large subunit ribosomal protein L25 [Venenivibrio stagnispumantis]